jgi:hypothetical protein
MFSNPATALARVNVKAMDFLLGRNRNFLFGRDTLRFLVIAPVGANLSRPFGITARTPAVCRFGRI